MSQRSRTNELFIGVIIALYGNWLIGAFDKIGQSDDLLAEFILASSIIFLLLYFQQVFKSPQRFVFGLRSLSQPKILFGLTHYLFVGVALSLVPNAINILNLWLGITLWLLLLWFERRPQT